MAAPEAHPRSTEHKRWTLGAPLPPALALLPLRAFLGITFVYAGVQKLSDPGFLHKGAPSYIGSQLHSFAQGTPGGFLLRAFAVPHPALAGVGVALVEIGVGLLVLLGLRTRAAAAAGLSLNLVLFLTASWKTYPYFLGSDIGFVFAWLALALTGVTGQPALDHWLERRAAGRARPHPRRGSVGPSPRRRPQGAWAGDLTRRALVARALGAAGFATLGLGGLAALAKGSYRGGATARLGGTPSAAKGSSASGGKADPSGGSPAGSSSGSPPSGAVRLGRASQLQSGQAALYHDPSDGQPDVVVRLSDGSVTAHSALCTHAGCQVEYAQGSLNCPCHGSVFNARTGAVEQGPAVSPLPARKVIEHGGVLYAVRT